jgi:hypothetical protein
MIRTATNDGCAEDRLCLLKTPNPFVRWELAPLASTLCGDGVDSQGVSLGATRFVSIASCPAARGPRSATADPCARTGASWSVATLARRSRLLGLARPRLERMATRPDHRSARDGDRMASPRLPVVLEMEEPLPHRTSTSSGRRARADSHDVRSESSVGRATPPRRIAEAGDRHQSGVSREVHGPLSSAALADLAHVPDQSSRATDGRGLLRRANRDLPIVVRAGPARPRPSTNHAPRGDRSPDRSVDRTTAARGMPVGLGSALCNSRPRSCFRRIRPRPERSGWTKC